jgi:hypothetical protein
MKDAERYDDAARFMRTLVAVMASTSSGRALRIELGRVIAASVESAEAGERAGLLVAADVPADGAVGALVPLVRGTERHFARRWRAVGAAIFRTTNPAIAMSVTAIHGSEPIRALPRAAAAAGGDSPLLRPAGAEAARSQSTHVGER